MTLTGEIWTVKHLSGHHGWEQFRALGAISTVGGDDRSMRIEVLGVDCPVLPGVTVGIQRRKDVVDEHPADGTDIRWVLEARFVDGPDLLGPFVHGRPAARFLYLCWRRSGVGFRRAKLMLDEVPANVLLASRESGLHARLGLTMKDGSPVCAAVRPPNISWVALG